MARRSYGSAVKYRTKLFLAALLDYANNQLKVEENSLRVLRGNLETKWQSEIRLLVRTQVRSLETLTRLVYPTNPLNSQNVKEVLNRLKDFLAILEDNRFSPAGSHTWEFTINLWHPRHQREANLQTLETEWENRRSLKSKQADDSPSTDSAEDEEKAFWQDICRHSLSCQKYDRLTTNPLTFRDGFTFEFQQVYIPQALVKHSSASKETNVDETAKAIMVEEFLAQLLLKPQPLRLAIIGEPGTGKTTLFQKIAHWLLETSQLLPIWISLADLHEKTLEEHLLQDWLPMNINPVGSRQIAAFKDQFYLGRVWLLLDGIDEMPGDGNMALAKLARQFKSWVGQSNILLTCRANVWDSGKNALYDFEAYSPLSFSYSNLYGENQVAAFIHRWFKNTPTLGQSLNQHLSAPARKSIREAIKSPLRLALICHIWSLGKFPTTLTNLYHQFTEAHYDWKQDNFPCSRAARQKLNEALGKLAIRAIGETETKFRLPYHLVMEALDEANTGFLTLAMELGWLKSVGNLYSETIYAFCHPTFQEYFAAGAILNWQSFLPIASSQTCPIFETRWQEVILFWMGRNDIPKIEKEKFINYLLNFSDECGGFYRFKAYFLAGILLTEFPECDRALEIVSQLVEWRFGKFDPIQRHWQNYPPSIAETARSILLYTDRPTAVTALENFVQSVQNLSVRWQASYSLGKIFAFGNPVAVASLKELIEVCETESLQIKIAESLGKIIPKHPTAEKALLKIIESTESPSIRRKAAYNLGKISPGHPIAMDTLREIIASNINPTLSQQARENLLKLSQGYVVATSPKRAINQGKKSSRSPDLNKAIEALEMRLESTDDERKILQFAGKLGKLNPGNKKGIEVLIKLLKFSADESIRQLAGTYLQTIVRPQQITAIIRELKNHELTDECKEVLWYFTQQVSYFEFLEAWGK